MPQDHFSLNSRAALLAAIASAYPVWGHAAPAAQVDFAVGNVTAVGPNGKSRPLGKGARIEQGDTVNTNGGRAQLRFTDGAYVSLQPESQFRIDQYRYDGKPDGNEKGFFSLLKGGLRTITGLVGRTNKANYQVSTSVATIGIRGTEYTIEYGHSVTGTVGEGEINVCNGGGCLSVTNGESYYVQTQETKPVLTSKRTDLPPPEPTQPPLHVALGDNTDASGNPLPGLIMTGLQSPVSYGRISSLGIGCFACFGSATFDGNGVLTDLNGQTLDSIVMGGNDGIIAWGTGINTSSGAETVHFVIGMPTPASDLAKLAISNPIATYTVIGATTPTFSQGFLSKALNGTFVNASLTANFAAMTVDTSISAKFNLGLPGILTVGASGTNQLLSGSTFSFSACTSGSCTLSGGSCSSTFVHMAGFLAGPNAIRAGLIYDINVSGTTSANATFSGNADGAVAFAKK